MADIRILRGPSQLKEHKPKPNPKRREKNGGILNHIAKFAIDSTIIFSLKSRPGRKQAYEIVQEGLKDQPLSVYPDDKKKPENLNVAMEEMQARMENVQEDMNNIKQQHQIQISAKHVAGSEDMKKVPGGGIQGSDLVQNDKKKIFIRSRL